jgi:methionine sulfoxide reductase heme-binding subunit
VDGAARQRLVKAGAWGVALAPAVLLLADAARHRLGANPIEAVLNRLGFWTFTFLVLSLVPTPLHRWLGLTWPLRVRRLLGVTAFTYAALHFSWYLGVDQFFDLKAVGADVVKRPFITVGFAALLLLLPLAVTSTDGWVRRLGFARWKALHRLAYAAALLGVVHFLWRVKADKQKPTIFAVLVVTLLLLRLRRPRRRAPPPDHSGRLVDTLPGQK